MFLFLYYVFSYGLLELFDSSVSYIVRGVETGQIRFIQRAIRQTTSLRHDVDRSHITNIVHRYLPRTSTIFSVVKDSIDRLPMSDNVLIEPSTVPTTILPEVEVYLLHLVIVALLSAKLYEDAAFVSSVIVQHIKQYNRRTLDLLSAKVYYYFSISYEKIHKLENIRSVLMTAYQTACYHNDAMSQSTLLNLLIHNYLEYDLIEQIQILTEKTNIFSDAGSDSSFISHNQYCRYAYYIGRANAIQLEYSSAYALLSMALRKSPQEVAFGFATQTIKLIVLVQLLMGGIPERSIFNHTNMEVRAALIPYLYLTQAVRAGNIQQFHQIANHPVYKEVFRTDKNMSLVRRLGHNVLKTGLKKISMSYSRISFKDIAEKLHLSSPEATEFICAKAIRYVCTHIMN